MGLETVEMVMAIEEEFGIEIPETDAEGIIKVGDLSDHVIAKLAAAAPPNEPPDPYAVWARVKEITVYITGVNPDRVTKSALFIDDLGIS